LLVPPLSIRQKTIMSKKNTVLLKYSFLLLILLSYILGFFLRENIAGGAEKDFLFFTWPGILAFKENFANTIINWSKIGEGSTPLFHILNAYLNPFTYNQISFQASIALISLLNVVFFSQILVEKFKLKNVDALLYSSIFLILPFFRSSGFWGITENLGWLFLIVSIKFFLKVEKNKNFLFKNIFLTCLFSSLALYTRPYLIFFPIFIALYFLINKKYTKLKFTSIFYVIFSLPGWILLYLWDGKIYLGEGINRINFIEENHHPKFILQNLIIFPSIVLFYLLPIEFLNFFQKLKIDKNKLFKFLILFLFLITLNSLNLFDYLEETKLGGGAFLKLNQFFFKDNFIFFILISSLGIMVIVEYLKFSNKNFVLFIIFLFIYSTPKYIYQEYFEPLVLILLFSVLDLKHETIKLIKTNQSIIFFYTYFIGYFVVSYYYRYNLS